MGWLTTHQVAIGSVRVSLASLMVALAIIVVGFVLASKIANRVRGGIIQTANDTHRWRATLAQVIGYAMRVIAVSLGLQVAGVDIGSVLAAGAVVAVGVGIAMQKVAENFVSGVILMAERSIREGDIIEFEGRVARVNHMGIRATIALTLDDEEIIVPNSVLTQSAVKNLTLTQPVCRLRVHVGVSYSTDMDVAEEALRRAATDIEWREKERDPIILLTDFGPSSVDFEVSVWTRDVWALRRGQSDLRKAIWKAFRAADIAIPFPQLDIHLGESASVGGAATPLRPSALPNT